MALFPERGVEARRPADEKGRQGWRLGEAIDYASGGGTRGRAWSVVCRRTT